MVKILLLFCAISLSGCITGKVLRAKQTNYLFDTYFVADQHKFRIYQYFIFRITNISGRYVASGDTLYLLEPSKKGAIPRSKSYAVIDSARGALYYFSNDTIEPERFDLWGRGR